ncbi:PaaI family thioesterase [Terrabacter aerolatus]|uniref:Thioesterase n=1 Tax=Terrabacter aerolatus TaxID=422442 RepID=A0A512CWP1_9MICO|nr:PaaI family thioesterase [Terrabacter aerolatus]GEO28648.1 thioesterase [Terrabacter aerolatus]
MLSIQERLYPDLPCFGCGPGNGKGLRLQSYPLGDASGETSAETSSEASGGVVATFTPWPEHDNGLGYLNGGIIGTVLDCHSAAAVMLEAERRGWPPLPGADLAYVTAGLDVRYLRPAPLHDAVELRAVVTESDEPQITVAVQLLHDGKVRAEATAVWKRWRPRS